MNLLYIRLQDGVISEVVQSVGGTSFTVLIYISQRYKHNKGVAPAKDVHNNHIN